MVVIIQDLGSPDIWGVISKAGGAIGLLLAIAVYVLSTQRIKNQIA